MTESIPEDIMVQVEDEEEVEKAAEPDFEYGDEERLDLPQDMQRSLEQIRAEWQIFLQRVERLQVAHMNGGTKTDKKKAFARCKHAALCVRDSLRNFGRITL